jgi:hypothetical protein
MYYGTIGVCRNYDKNIEWKVLTAYRLAIYAWIVFMSKYYNVKPFVIEVLTGGWLRSVSSEAAAKRLGSTTF